MSSRLPEQEVPATVPESWGPLVRAASSLVALVVTCILYVVRDGPVEEGVIVGFVTAAHGSIWAVVGEIWKLRRHRELGRGASALLVLGTLAGLGGAVGSSGCASVEWRDDGVPCVVEAARVAAELAASILDEQDPAVIATLAVAHLVRLHEVCLEWVEPAPVELVVPVD